MASAPDSLDLATRTVASLCVPSCAAGPATHVGARTELSAASHAMADRGSHGCPVGSVVSSRSACSDEPSRGETQRDSALGHAVLSASLQGRSQSGRRRPGGGRERDLFIGASAVSTRPGAGWMAGVRGIPGVRASGTTRGRVAHAKRRRRRTDALPSCVSSSITTAASRPMGAGASHGVALT